jgi:hypothetical protein
LKPQRKLYVHEFGFRLDVGRDSPLFGYLLAIINKWSRKLRGVFRILQYTVCRRMLFWLLWQKLLSQRLLCCKLHTVNSSYYQLQLLAFYSTIRYQSNPAWQASSVLQYSVPNYPAVFLIVFISKVGMQIYFVSPQIPNKQFLGLIPRPQILKLLGMPVCRSQIHKFVMIILQIRKFSWCPSPRIPNPQNCKEKGSVSDPDPHWFASIYFRLQNAM